MRVVLQLRKWRLKSRKRGKKNKYPTPSLPVTFVVVTMVLSSLYKSTTYLTTSSRKAKEQKTIFALFIPAAQNCAQNASNML
jgi:hypothetical protein